MFWASVYGILGQPVALAYDQNDLTSLPCLLVLNRQDIGFTFLVYLNNISIRIIYSIRLPEDKREALKLNTPIVSIELHPNGEELLLGYAGGTAIVAQPQPIPVDVEAPPIAVTSTSENTQPESTERPEEAEAEKKPTVEPEVAAEAARDGDPDSVAKSPPSKQQSPLKKSKSSERRMTTRQEIRAQATKFRTFSRTIRSKIDHEEKYAPPPLPVPPSPRVIRIMPYTQALCCATWRITPSILAAERAENTSSEVLIAYDDGAYLTWIVPKLESEVDEPVIAVNQEVASVPYGPLPCAPIRRIVARLSVSGGVITAFVGGLPRAQHAEKHTISVVGGVEEHVCFQFGSAVCEFVILPSKPQCKSEESCSAEKEIEASKPTEAGSLLVLTERELVVIDLTQPSWPVIASPYLKHLDCTGITTVAHISLPSQLMLRLKEASNARGFEHWPVIGGQKNGGSCAAVVQYNDFNDLVAIAHADADVSLWHVVRGDCFEFLGRISTLAMMADASEVCCHAERKVEEEAWPPFRKAGDCACDVPAEGSVDARCAIHTLILKLVNDEVVMLVGGGAGNFSMWCSAGQKPFEPDVSKLSVDLLDGLDDKFTWEGHDAFRVSMSSYIPDSKILSAKDKQRSNFQEKTPVEGVFTSCPTSTPAFGLSYEPDWEALAIGSAHGFVLIDLKTHSVAYKFLTHNLPITPKPTVASVTREVAAKIVSSGRKLKATLRESFRKIRKVHTQISGSHTPAPTTEASTAKGDEEVNKTVSGVVEEAMATATSEEAGRTEAITPANQEPGTSKLSVNLPSLMKSTHFINSILQTANLVCVAASPKDNRAALKPPRTVALIVGTERGALIIHTIAWAAENALIEVNPVREVIFQHGAPVISICVLNSKDHFSPVTILFSEYKSDASCLPSLLSSIAEVILKSPGAVRAESAMITEKPAVEEEPAAETSTSAAPQPSAEDVAEGSEAKEAAKLVVNHELLICTEEQVRVMSLPSMKAKHKYHFVDKTDALLYGKVKHSSTPHRGKSESSTTDSAINAQSSEEVAPSSSAPAASQENAETNDREGTAPVATPEIDSPEQAENPEETTAATPDSAHKSPSLRRVLSFGLQKLPALGTTESEEWHAFVGSTNGRNHVFTIPGLRRVLKVVSLSSNVFYRHLSTCCSGKFMPSNGLTNACLSNSSNLAFWPFAGCVLIVDEISYALPCRLVSPVAVNGLKVAEEDDAYCVCLPEWARPKPPPPPTAATAALASADAASADANAVESNRFLSLPVATSPPSSEPTLVKQVFDQSPTMMMSHFWLLVVFLQRA
ncbi:hypothetical protein Aperf_G00000045797 [Anoplocephala perfoliata]